MSTILGIDQSISCTGVVVVTDGVLDHYETVTTPPMKGIYNKVFRIKSIVDQIVAIIGKYNPEVVYIEEIAFAGQGDAAKDLAGLYYVILVTLDRIGVKYVPVNIKTVKKLATGSGNAKKEDMFEALPDTVKIEFGTFPKTKGRYDLADAYHIAVVGNSIGVDGPKG